MKWLRSTKKDIPVDDRLKPGAVFEKYTVEKQLGQGGMGSVYLVRHNVLDSQFALKILSSDVASKNKQFVDRFIREAKLACKIRHPNLIAVHDAGQNPQNGLYYIVMDYVPGGSVRDRLKKTRRMPPDQALRIITQVADALTAACAHHMVHRDIKPDNIMFAADGSAKLADLGIAKSTDEQDTMITMAASVFGTPAYMSPEQAKDSSKVDSRADIYSLGIVFYEMLSGYRPFSGTTAIQILSQVMDASRIPDVRQICPDVPPELADLIARMTEKDLEKRIQSPEILVRELKKIQIPANLAGRLLRTRDELAATSSAVPLTAPTMPTAADAPAQAPSPAAEATMPTMATAAEAPAPAPAAEATMPTMATAVEAPAPAPATEATMPTMADTPVPTPEPVPEVKPQTVAEAPTFAPAPESAPAPAPAVTMPTMATAPSASAPAPEVTVPMQTAAAPAPEKKATPAPDKKPVPPAEQKASAPVASAPQKKGKGGVIVISVIAAACLVIVSVAVFAAVLLFKGGSPSEPPVPTQPGNVNPGTQSGGASMTVTDSPVVTPQPATGTKTAAPDAGQNPSGVTQTAVETPSATETKSATDELVPGPLRKNQIVLLADTSSLSRQAKRALSEAFGADKVSFREAEGMGGYKQLLKDIVKSEPSVVVLCFAQQYADDGISASGFENVVAFHADQFRENGIPFLIVQPVRDDDDARIRAYIDATTDLCRQRSISFAGADDVSGGKFVSLVREEKKPE